MIIKKELSDFLTLEQLSNIKCVFRTGVGACISQECMFVVWKNDKAACGIALALAKILHNEKEGKNVRGIKTGK